LGVPMAANIRHMTANIVCFFVMIYLTDVVQSPTI